MSSFYFSKLPEFIDTVIMMLKRNYHQVSFLHVYHHSSIFLIWWLVTFLAPTGEAWYSAMLNSFIHVIMYGYYFSAAIGFRGVDFVKRYITMMQMTQFVTMMGQVSSALVRARLECSDADCVRSRQPTTSFTRSPNPKTLL